MNHAFITIHKNFVSFRVGNRTGSNPGSGIETLADVSKALAEFYKVSSFEIRDERGER